MKNAAALDVRFWWANFISDLAIRKRGSAVTPAILCVSVRVAWVVVWPPLPAARDEEPATLGQLGQSSAQIRYDKTTDHFSASRECQRSALTKRGTLTHVELFSFQPS